MKDEYEDVESDPQHYLNHPMKYNRMVRDDKMKNAIGAILIVIFFAVVIGGVIEYFV